MSENTMKPRNYVGNGKKSGEWYVNFSLKKSQIMEHFYDYKGEEYIRLTMGQNKEETEWGNTHSIWVNEYDPKKQEEAKAPASTGSGLPF